MYIHRHIYIYIYICLCMFVDVPEDLYVQVSNDLCMYVVKISTYTKVRLLSKKGFAFPGVKGTFLPAAASEVQDSDHGLLGTVRNLSVFCLFEGEGFLGFKFARVWVEGGFPEDLRRGPMRRILFFS